jgi:DEAD/DEAH box helicase domain-containing protein
MIEVVFDIETMNLFGDNGASTPGQLGVSIVSAYRREVDNRGFEKNGEMKSFWDKEAKNIDGGIFGFEGLWEWFNEADRIIGFNSLGFDVPALAGLFTLGNIYSLPHFDILEKVKNVLGHRLSLDAIAKETLGYTKIDDGLNAVKYWRSGTPEEMAKLRKYCEMDVVVTTDVYKYAVKNGKLKYKDKWNEAREMEVDFSYPKLETPPELQMGLF